MTLGDRIRYVRQLRGMTQTELAEKAGFTADENGRIRISQYENDSRIPRKETLKKISEALGVHSYYLSLDEHTAALDFAYALLEWDRTTNFIIRKEMVENKDHYLEEHYLIDFNTDFFNDFFKEWMQKKANLKDGKISKDDYIEWTINLK